jgi:hypothetical protein
MTGLRFGLLAAAVLLLVPTARADTLTGELRGQVIDLDTGTPLVSARLILTSIDRGWTRELVTGAQGEYAFLQLDPGNYTLQAESGGYYSLNRTDILIRLNRLRVLLPPFELRRIVSIPTREITLQGELVKRAIVDLSATGPTPVIIAITEEIGGDAMVSLGDAALRFNFGADLLSSLPLSGSRSFDQLALLAPGAALVPFSGGYGPAVGLGVGVPGQFSIHGLRGRSNSYTMDGSDTNDEDIGVRRQGFLAQVPQTSESIQDFQVLTAGPPAELGRSAGAWVNAVSRSGSTHTHGVVSALFGHHHLQAGNPLARPFADTLNTGRLNGGSWSTARSRESQAIAALGGRVTSSIFYFASADFRSQSATRVAHFIVPSPEERGLRTRGGTVPIEELGAFLQGRNLAYRSQAGLGVFSLLPLPNHPAGPFGDHTYSQVRQEDGTSAIGSLKVDWNPTPEWAMVARYNLTNDDLILPFTGEALNSSLGTSTRTQNLSLYAHHTGPVWARGVRVSYGRTRLDFPSDRGDPLLFGSAAEPGGVSVAPIQTGYGRFGPFGATGPIGQLQVMPYSPVGIDVFNFPQGRVNNSSQAVGTWSRFRGNHQLKFGLELRRAELNSFSDRNSRPLVQFAPGYISGACLQNPVCIFATPDGLLSGTDAAALGAPAGMLQTLSTQSVPNSAIGLSFYRWEGFVQDDWRLAQSLYFNLGVRFELQTVPKEAQNRLESTFGLSSDQFSRLLPSHPGACQGELPLADFDPVVCAGNSAFDRALTAWNRFLEGRTRIYGASRADLSPRVGFAWDPGGRGRHVVRGGYWLINEAQLGAVTSQSRNVFPTFVPLNLDLNFSPPDGRFLNNPAFFRFAPTGELLVVPGSLNQFQPVDAFATGLGTLFIQSPPFPGAPLSSNGLAFTLPRRDLAPGYAQHFTLSIERRWGSHHVTALRYVGTKGRRLTRFQAPNAGPLSIPVLFSSPLLGLTLLDLPPHPGAVGEGRPDPDLGAYTVFENTAGSEYHSLQVTLERRFHQALQFHFHWTWSHALDEVSDPFETRGAPSFPQVLTRTDLEWGHAGFDVRHRAAGYLLWRPEADSRWKGWSAGARIQVQTGQPFTVTTALDRNQDGNLSDRLDRTDGIIQQSRGLERLRLDEALHPLDLLAARGASGMVGRNTFRAAGLSLVDISISRRFALRDPVVLELRTEVFNALDQTSFGIPIRVLESPGFGRSYDLQAEPRSARILLRLVF